MLRPSKQGSSSASSTSVSATLEHDKKKKKYEYSSRSTLTKINCWILFSWGSFFGLIFALVYTYHHQLPQPAASSVPYTQFSEARAHDLLERIVEFGIRIVGSEANEQQVPNLLLQEIQAIQQQKQAHVLIDVDIQKPYGSFGLDFLSQFQNIYANITNIIVRVSPSIEAQEHALLLSAHYDAAIGSTAASDDGASIAIMIELLRIFSHDPPKEHAIIFNFNGAEETVLQAAHGFVTQHPWTRSIRAFINMEAAGAGGRELLFQSGSEPLTEAYIRGAKYPHGSTFAEEVFQSGIIPSDTDFRVYRDYGGLPGLDFAFIANGYVYHTILDDLDAITPGSLQRFGTNLVGCIRELVDQKKLLLEAHASTSGVKQIVYFDFLGLVAVMIPKAYYNVLACCIILTSFLYFRFYDAMLTIPLLYQGWLDLCKIMTVASLSTITLAIFTSAFMPLSWYSNPFLCICLFTFPWLCGFITALKHRVITAQSITTLERRLFEACLCGWTFLLISCFVYGILSAYLLAFWVIFPLLGHILAPGLTPKTCLSYLTIKLLSFTIPTILSSQLMLTALEVFIPITGRSGTLLPADLLIAVFIAIFAVILLSYFTSLLCRLHPALLHKLQMVFLIATFIALVVARASNPYTTTRPKRLFCQHIEREFVLDNGKVVRDSGIWIGCPDFLRNEPLREAYSKLEWAQFLEPPKDPEGVNKDLYGNLPWFLPIKSLMPQRHSWYIPTAPPKLPKSKAQVRLRVLSSDIDSATSQRTIHLEIKGPAHISMFIDATQTQLVEWSLGNGTDCVPPDEKYGYYLHFGNGSPPATFNFWITAATAAPVSVAYWGHYTDVSTPEIDELQKATPDYVSPISLISVWRHQVI